MANPSCIANTRYAEKSRNVLSTARVVAFNWTETPSSLEQRKLLNPGAFAVLPRSPCRLITSSALHPIVDMVAADPLPMCSIKMNNLNRPHTIPYSKRQRLPLSPTSQFSSRRPKPKFKKFTTPVHREIFSASDDLLNSRAAMFLTSTALLAQHEKVMQAYINQSNPSKSHMTGLKHRSANKRAVCYSRLTTAKALPQVQLEHTGIQVLHLQI